MGNQNEVVVGHYASIHTTNKGILATILGALRSLLPVSEKKERKMSIADLAKKITELEGKKKQVNIAQVREILKCINKVSGGTFYKWVRNL